MKILYVITKGNWGGAQRYVFDLAVAAKARGYDVAVAFGEPGKLQPELAQAGIRTIPLPIKNEGSFIAIRHAKEILKKLFEEEKPDIVHLNSSLVGISGAWAARSANWRRHAPNVIFTDHGWVFMEKRSIPMRIVLWCISWITTLLVDKIIVVSDYELKLTKRMPFAGKKTVRIYNGLDLHMQFGSGDIIRQAFPAGVKITGTVGELTKNKNQITLIEEAKNNPAMYVAIVGQGVDRPMLESKIKEYGLSDRVKLFGFQPAHDVLKGFDIFALPSVKESLGFAVLEARIAGLPIIANRVGGVGEALDKPLSEFSKEKMVEETLALYNN
jgi:glycosyltransferase involved in cell wall biosynthesis